MFGGLTFLLNGKMFCGIVKRDLMVRVGPDHYEESLRLQHVRPMDFTGKPLKGYVDGRVPLDVEFSDGASPRCSVGVV